MSETESVRSEADGIVLPPERGRSLSGVAVAVLVGLLGFGFQGSRGVWEPDEGFYSNVAVGMLDHGDGLTPRLNGEPFLDKPPLAYWGAAAGILVFGRNEWGLRAANALWYLGTALLVGLLARRLLGPEHQTEAVLLYALAPLPFLAANVLTPDTPLAFAVVAAMTSFWYRRCARSRAARLAANLAFALAVALGVLAKGPAVLVFLAPLGLFVVWQDGLRGLLRSVDLAIAGLLGLAFGLAWYAEVVGKLPGGWRFVLDNQVLGRLAGAKYGRNADSLGALRVYLPALLVGLFPWGLIELFRRRFDLPRRWQLRKPDEVGLFLVVSCALPLLVLCIASSRLPLYVLPLVPACSLWLTRSRVRRGAQMNRKTIVIATASLLTIKLAAAYFPASRDARAMAATLNLHGVSQTKPLIALAVKQNGLAFYGFGSLIWLPAPGESRLFFSPSRPLSEVLAGAALEDEFTVIYRLPVGELVASGVGSSPGIDCYRQDGPFRYRLLRCRTLDGFRGESAPVLGFPAKQRRPATP